MAGNRWTEVGVPRRPGRGVLVTGADTGLLLDRLLSVPGSRGVTVASIAHLRGTIDLDDPPSERSCNASAACGRSKLANLTFTYEVQRRLAASGAGTIALAAHPGVSVAELNRNMSRTQRAPMAAMGPLFLQTPGTGALPTLRAAVDPGARGGEYYGPSGPGGLRGHPVPVRSSPASHDAAAQARLWAESERLTGIVYGL